MQTLESLLDSQILSLAANSDLEGLILSGKQALSTDPAEAARLAEAALQLADQHGTHAGTARALLLAGNAYRRLSEYRSAVEYLEKARGLLTEPGEESEQLECLLELSRCHRALGQVAAAGECLNHALGLSREFGLRQAEADALNGLAAVSYLLGNPGHALERVEAALVIRRALGDVRGEIDCLNNIGIIRTETGNYAEGLDALVTAHDLIGAHCPDAEAEANCLINIGNVYQQMEQFEGATASYARALALAEEANLLLLEIIALTNLAETQVLEQHIHEAIPIYEEVLARSRAAGARSNEIDAMEGLARIWIKAGQSERALDLIVRALELSRAVGERVREIQLLIDRSEVEVSLNQPAAARASLELARDLARQTNSMRFVQECETRLSEHLASQGDIAGAFAAYKAAHKLERELFNQERDRRLQSLSTQFEMVRTQQEAETVRQRSEEIQRLNDQLESRVRERTRDLEKAQLETVIRLAAAAEYRDDSTGQHTQRVGLLASLLAQAVGLPPAEVELIRVAARLHDVGKIGVADRILLKAGKLDDDEYQDMKAHTLIGAQILSGGQAPVLQMAELIALHHHERWDGSGYPHGLSGEAIPLVGRIVAVADVYDALTSSRPYKAAWTPEEALVEIERQSGKMFDPHIARQLRAVVGEYVATLTNSAALPTVIPPDPSATPRPASSQTARPADQPQIWSPVGTLGNQATGVPETPANPGPPADTDQFARVDGLLETAWELRTSNPERCMKLSQQALATSVALTYQRGIAHAHRNIGFCHFMNADFEQAITDLTDGRERAVDLGDHILTRDCLNYLGAVYHSLGDYATSIEYVHATLDLSGQAGDQPGIASALTNLGLLNHYLGRNDEAIKYHTESLNMSRALGDIHREMAALNNLGIALTALRRDEEAMDVLSQVLSLASELGDADLRTRALVNLSEVHERAGRHETALRLSDAARALLHAAGNLEGEAHALLTAGLIRITSGDRSGALSTFEHGLKIATEIGSKALSFKFHKHLAEVCKTLGRAAEALEHYVKYHELESAVRAEEVERKGRAGTAQREIERTRSESEIYRLRNIELARVLNSLQEADRQKSHLLRELNEKSALLERQVTEDPLTGVSNRRQLELRLAHEFARCRAEGSPISVIMLDIDHFKRINDRFSHQVGDQVIRTVAELIVKNSRRGSLVARYGGEEFVVALPGVPSPKALIGCERIRRAVEAHDWSGIHPNLRVTVSVGLADDPAQADHEKLLNAADAKLYEAKRAGRNRTCS